MTRLLTIDPGLRKCGAALWKDGALVAADLLNGASVGASLGESVEAMSLVVAVWVGHRNGLEVAAELPRTYGGIADRGDANDLIAVALVVGAVLGRFDRSIKLIEPHDWKGSITKPKRAADPYPVEQRILGGKLTPAELAAVRWPGDARKRWDVADAIGIGLKLLGRW